MVRLVPATLLAAATFFWLVSPNSMTVSRHEHRVNDFTDSEQAHVAIDRAPNGTLVAVWDSRRQQTGTYGVYSRRLSALGEPIGPEEEVNLKKTSMQHRPAVVVDDNSVPTFVWTSEFQDGDAGSVIARSAGLEHQLHATAAGDQRAAALCGIGGRHLAAAWETGTARARRVVVRQFDPSAGDSGRRESVIPAPCGTIDRLPAIDATPDGFVVTWARETDGGLPLGILAQRFNRAAEPMGPPITVSAAAAVEPSIAAGDHGFVVAWLRSTQAFSYDVVARRFDQDGAARGPEFVVTEKREGRQNAASIDCLADGRFTVAWNDVDGFGNSDVLARWFDADGRPVTGDVLVTIARAGSQRLTPSSGSKRISLADDGSLAVAWSGDGELGDESGAHVSVLALRSRLASLQAAVSHHLSPDAATNRTAGPAMISAEPYMPPSLDPTRTLQPVENDVRPTTAGIGFTGFTNTGWNPPDPHMAAGPENLVLIVNGGIAARGRNGESLWQLPIEGSSGFWGDIGAGGFVFDPEVIYDVLSDRFFAIANERTGGRSYFLLAVSASSDATGSWHKYRFDVTSLAEENIDSPNLGVDDEVVYLTADFFDPDEHLFYMVEKDAVLNGGSPITTHILHTGTHSMGVASMYSVDAPQMYFIHAGEEPTEDEVRFWTVNDPLGSPSLTLHDVAVPIYHHPSRIPHAGSSATIAAFEARFWSCMYRDGSMWAAHHVGVSDGGKTVARWYEFAMNGWPVSGSTPSLIQTGTTDFGGDIVTSFNSIFADADGNAAMVMTRSAPDEPFSIWRAHRKPGDPLGTMNATSEVETSFGVVGTVRWGDYSAVVADPVNPGTFWLHHQSAEGTWTTWVESFAVSGAVSVPGATTITGGLELVPSPSRGATRFRFTLTDAAEIEVDVYSVAGRRVAHRSLGVLPGRAHDISWDGLTDAGGAVANGVYLARVVAGGRVIGTNRLVIAR